MNDAQYTETSRQQEESARLATLAADAAARTARNQRSESNESWLGSKVGKVTSSLKGYVTYIFSFASPWPAESESDEQAVGNPSTNDGVTDSVSSVAQVSTSTRLPTQGSNRALDGMSSGMNDSQVAGAMQAVSVGKVLAKAYVELEGGVEVNGVQGADKVADEEMNEVEEEETKEDEEEEEHKAAK
jgi:hypothetical protein